MSERMTVSLADMSEMINRGTRAMLEAAYADMERTRYFYLGYTRLEESMWTRFNRCCNPGRKIRIKERPVYIRAGKPTIRTPKGRSHETNLAILAAAQPSTPADVTTPTTQGD